MNGREAEPVAAAPSCAPWEGGIGENDSFRYDDVWNELAI